MAELLDVDGVWSEELIALMVPVAIEMQADQSEAMFGAFGAAASGLFSEKGPEAFQKAIAEVKRQVRDSQRRARGDEAGAGETAATKGTVRAPAGPNQADHFLGLMQKAGVRIPKPLPRRGKKKPKGGR
jgi:hypothetical protein